MPRMIARLWKGVAASAAGADAYERHLTAKVLPSLSALEGHRGARVLRRENEFLVITFWESIEAVRRFAGADPERAVVEPEARAVLREYDERVSHYEVVR
jgi:heme-degrading monooxygenase HmoA